MKIFEKIKEKSSLIAYPLMIATIITGAITYGQYGDHSKSSKGRTKNAISSVVSGIVAQKIYKDQECEIDLEVQRKFYPDTTITGTVTPYRIETNLDSLIRDTNFIASTSGENELKGEVKKAEFNWIVYSKGNDKYDIKRMGIKFDNELELTVANGKIDGTFVRNGLRFDWDISGTYDDFGNVNIEIDGPLTLGINLEGKITRK